MITNGFKYATGDTVLVRSDLNRNTCNVNDSMLELRGTLVTIRGFEMSETKMYYRIIEDSGKWYWEESFFDVDYCDDNDVEYGTLEDSEILDFLLGGDCCGI